MVLVLSKYDDETLLESFAIVNANSMFSVCSIYHSILGRMLPCVLHLLGLECFLIKDIILCVQAFARSHYSHLHVNGRILASVLQLYNGIGILALKSGFLMNMVMQNCRD